MIKIKEIKLANITTVDGVEIIIQPFKTNVPNIQLICYLMLGDANIFNHDNEPLGIKIDIPVEIIDSWGNDDTVIEDWVLNYLGFERAV